MVSNRVIDLNAATQAGGVSVAIYDTLARHPGFWFGWNGKIEEENDTAAPVTTTADGHTTVTVSLTADDYNDYYLGYSNSVLWPVFHNRLDLAQFEAGYYARYVAVNAKLADVLAPLIEPDDVIWIHDYHLLPMALELRRRGIENPIGYFLHIPVGSAQALLAIPEYRELARSLSAYDLIGLQTPGDVRNLIDFLLQSVSGRLLPTGRIRVFDAELDIGCFPVGIEPSEFASPDHSAQIESSEPSRIIGIDRLDYTKGLPQKFRAFGKLLEEYPEYRRRIVLSQFAPPTRESVEAYADIKSELESLSGSINGRYGELDWVPINYIHRTMPRNELRDIYRSSRVGWVTPLMDGMNLVAKEFVASQNPQDPGVLDTLEVCRSRCAIDRRGAGQPLRYQRYDAGTCVRLSKCRRKSGSHAMKNSQASSTSLTLAAWSSSYYSALVKAGERRLGRTAQSSPRMNEALDRLKTAIKKNSEKQRF